jgi:hypothetical protein
VYAQTVFKAHAWMNRYKKTESFWLDSVCSLIRFLRSSD